MIFVIAQAITNAGITNFNPLIISGYGFSQAKTTLLATPQAAVAMVAQALLTALTFFVPNIRCLLWVITSLIAMAGAIMVHVIDQETNRNASLAGVYIMGFYNVPWVLALSLQTSNTSGTGKKSFVSISIAIFYGEIITHIASRRSDTNHEYSCRKHRWTPVLLGITITYVFIGHWSDAMLLCNHGSNRGSLFSSVLFI